MCAPKQEDSSDSSQLESEDEKPQNRKKFSFNAVQEYVN